MTKQAVLVLVLAYVLPSIGLAAPERIAYQGRLVDGTNLFSGSATMIFQLFTEDQGGSPLYSETQAVVVVDSLYNVQIGASNSQPGVLSAAINGPSNLWLGLKVNDVTLTPRERLASVPYALNAWQLGGNDSVVPGQTYLGTRNVAPLDIRVNQQRALLIVPGPLTPHLIGGHFNNSIPTNVSGSVIGGGGTFSQPNMVSNAFAVVSGGLGNRAMDYGTVVSGGEDNLAGGDYTVIAGGAANEADGFANVIGGGTANYADSFYGVVGGGGQNQIIGQNSVIAGGLRNQAFANYSAVIGGGEDNSNQGDFGTVAGGWFNTIQSSSEYSAIGGGRNNQASGYAVAISGGEGNQAAGLYSLVAGGLDNEAMGDLSAIGGGERNQADGDNSFIGGGLRNRASGYASVVVGGEDNIATNYSFAAGRNAQANHIGSFVWGDNFNATVTSSAANQWTVRAGGGVRFFSSQVLTTGVELAAGGTGWNAVSDRHVKENIEPVDPFHILEKINTMPINRWNMITQDADQTHIGPMAQDFYAAFQLGTSDRTINSVDADGVSMAAIQGLYRLVLDLQRENAELRSRIEAIETPR